jgi:hypothetical protein
VAQVRDAAPELGSGQAFDLALESIDALVERVQELEEGVADVVDDRLDDLAGPAPSSTRAVRPSIGASSPSAPDFRTVRSAFGDASTSISR